MPSTLKEAKAPPVLIYASVETSASVSTTTADRKNGGGGKERACCLSGKKKKVQKELQRKIK